MKKIFSNIIRCTLMVCVASFLTGCQEKGVEMEASYLDVAPEVYSDTALGEGDAFLISIRSNVEWTLSAVDSKGAQVDWIRFDVSSGTGDADVIGFILRGDREEDRTCTIVLSAVKENLQKTLTMKQGVFTPVLLDMTVSDIVKTAYPLAAGETVELTDFGVLEALVVGVPGENLPEGYIYVTDEGASNVRIKTSVTSGIKVGDRVKIETTEGTVTKDAFGGCTADIKEMIKVLSSGEPVKPVFIEPTAVSRYENALVELKYAQAQEQFVGKPWSGEVDMMTVGAPVEDAFKAYVETSATFASGNIPACSGSIVGIVKDGKVRPRNADDLAGLTQSRGEAYSAPYMIEPIVNIFKIGSKKNTFSNGSISDSRTFVFTEEPSYSVEGASIEKVGGKDIKGITVAVATPFQSCFTTKNWNRADSYLLYTIPVKQKINGDLEFVFSLSCGTAGVFSEEWTVQWSKDGSTFNDVDAVYSTDQITAELAKGPNFKLTSDKHFKNRCVAAFNIPEEESFSTGNLYMKLSHPPVPKANASTTLRINCGFVLCSSVADTPDLGWDNVLAMENFEDVQYALNPLIGVPTYYLPAYAGGPEYLNAEGWSVGGLYSYARGSMLLGAPKDNGNNISAAQGPCFITTPQFSQLKSATDIVLTFKAAPFVDPFGTATVVAKNNISVNLTGSGKLGDIVWDSAFDSDPYSWHTATVKITGASSDTRLNIGVFDETASESSFYIDDVIVRR